MVPRFIILLSVATLILLGLHYYVFERTSRYLALGPTEQRMLKLVLGALFVLVWTAMPLGRLLTMDGARPLFYAAFVWLGTLVLLSVGLLFGDIARWVSSVLPLDEGWRAWLVTVAGRGSLA